MSIDFCDNCGETFDSDIDLDHKEECLDFYTDEELDEVVDFWEDRFIALKELHRCDKPLDVGDRIDAIQHGILQEIKGLIKNIRTLKKEE